MGKLRPQEWTVRSGGHSLALIVTWRSMCAFIVVPSFSIFQAHPWFPPKLVMLGFSDMLRPHGS
jgi:hypothetical protein